MAFFGAVFATLTLFWQWHVTGAAAAAPFALFAIIAAAAVFVIRLPGAGIEPSERVARVILWSSIGEGIGLFLAANIVINLHCFELLLPAMALVVGLHFLPIAYAAAFRAFYVLGGGLCVTAAIGFIVGPPAGGEIAGSLAAAALWSAAVIAIMRDRRWKMTAISP